MSGVSKVIFGGKTLVDLTGDTVSAGVLRKGYTAHDKSGAEITGTLPDVALGTISISVNSAGLVTASINQSAGYVPGGTGSKTHQLTTQAAQTITPGTTDKTIAAGTYLTGVQTIKGDANLSADNIKKDVTIFGVTGTMEAGATVYSGTGAPASSLGANGDIYVKTK